MGFVCNLVTTRTTGAVCLHVSVFARGTGNILQARYNNAEAASLHVLKKKVK